MSNINSTPWNIDFLGKRNICYVISLILVGYSIFLWVNLGDSKYGTDFKGGNELVVSIQGDSDVDQIRQLVSTTDLPDLQVQSFEREKDKDQYSIKVGVTQMGPAAVKEKILLAINQQFPEKVEIIRADFVGPTIGKELFQQAIIATLLGLGAIMIYVAWRFEFAFALGAVIALFHDVIVATGVYLFAGHSLNMATLAAALTIVGYSVNDTIVIFDRVREEIYKRTDFDLAQLINESMNYCLSRTIITSLLTLFSALALLILGGGAISDLSLFLVAGMISGTYSTVYIAAPIVLTWNNFRVRRANRRGTTASLAS